MVQSQQACTMILSGHITALYTKLAYLDKQTHSIYLHSQSDTVQLNALDYNPDIDEEPDPVNAIQPSNADSVKEDNFTGTSKPEDQKTQQKQLGLNQQTRWSCYHHCSMALSQK